MLTANCTPEAIAMNDPRGDLRRAGFRFDRMPVTIAWLWVDEATQVRLAGGRLEVKTPTRTLSWPLVSRSAPLSHAKMLAEILHNHGSA